MLEKIRTKKGRQKWRAKRAILLMRPFWCVFFRAIWTTGQLEAPYRLGRLGCGRRPHEKRERNLFSHPIFPKYFRKSPKLGNTNMQKKALVATVCSQRKMKAKHWSSPGFPIFFKIFSQITQNRPEQKYAKKRLAKGARGAPLC